MYKVIGADSKEYGPVSTEDIRGWLREGRLGPNSLLQAEGQNQWRPLSAFPEFAGDLATHAMPPLVEPASANAMNPEWERELLQRDYELRIGDCLSRGFHLFTANFFLFVGAFVVAFILQIGCNAVPFLGPIIANLSQGVFQGGLTSIYLKRIRGQSAGISDLFDGFRIQFGQLILGGLVVSILSLIGFACCVLPWVYLAVAWAFTIPFIFDKRMEFWSAMELSRKLITKRWWSFLALFIVLFLIMFAIPMICGFLTLAFGAGVIQPFFSQKLALPPGSEWVFALITFGVGVVGGALITMPFMAPFAFGTLLYAYEDTVAAGKPGNP
jgi:hypothetical protein